MARPIRNTPILWGEDATIFIQSTDMIPSEESRKAEHKSLEESVSRLNSMLANLRQ